MKPSRPQAAPSVRTHVTSSLLWVLQVVSLVLLVLATNHGAMGDTTFDIISGFSPPTDRDTDVTFAASASVSADRQNQNRTEPSSSTPASGSVLDTNHTTTTSSSTSGGDQDVTSGGDSDSTTGSGTGTGTDGDKGDVGSMGQAGAVDAEPEVPANQTLAASPTNNNDATVSASASASISHHGRNDTEPSSSTPTSGLDADINHTTTSTITMDEDTTASSSSSSSTNGHEDTSDGEGEDSYSSDSMDIDDMDLYDNTTSNTADNNSTDETTTSFPQIGFDPKAMGLALNYLQKFMGLLSILGCSYVIYCLAGTAAARQERMKTTFNRFLFLLSFFDIISSFAYFLANWPVPQEAPAGMAEAVDPNIFDYDLRFPTAAGNRTSCAARGFVCFVGSLGSAIFTGFISAQYVLKVRYQWTERSMRRLEKAGYLLGFLYPFGIGTYMLARNQFNASRSGSCWINNYPIVCDPYYFEQDPTIEDWCLQNPDHIPFEGVEKSMFFFTYYPITAVLLVVIVSMLLLYCTVRGQEQRVQRFSTNAASGRFSRMAIRKGILLISGFLVMYLPVITIAAAHKEIGALLIATFLPMQGVLNAFVYSGTAEKFFESCFCGLCCGGTLRAPDDLRGSSAAVTRGITSRFGSSRRSNKNRSSSSTQNKSSSGVTRSSVTADAVSRASVTASGPDPAIIVEENDRKNEQEEGQQQDEEEVAEFAEDHDANAEEVEEFAGDQAGASVVEQA